MLGHDWWRRCRSGKPVSSAAVRGFVEVPARVGERSFQLVLPEASDDPIVAAYIRGEEPNAYLMELLRRFAPAGGTVVDLGCHTGTFSVPAAVAGWRVVAVDASPLHVESVKRSAERNRLEELTVVHAAVGDRSTTVSFHADGLFGTVLSDGGAEGAEAIRVRGSTVPALLREAGVDPRSVDFVKADVEGSELAAFAGMVEMLTGPDAPPIVYESNPMTSKPMGFSVDGIRTALEILGYRTYRKEGESFLVCPPLEPQPEAWLDVIALKARHIAAADVSTGAWPFAELVERTVAWGQLEHANVREYVGELLMANWLTLSADPRVVELAERLQRDPEPAVRAAVAGLALGD